MDIGISVLEAAKSFPEVKIVDLDTSNAHFPPKKTLSPNSVLVIANAKERLPKRLQDTLYAVQIGYLSVAVVNDTD